MDNPITRAEHEEFRRRMEEEHSRVNKRLELLEEQVQQGKRLAVLENRDGEKWRSVVGYVITLVVGLAVGYIATSIGIGG